MHPEVGEIWSTSPIVNISHEDHKYSAKEVQAVVAAKDDSTVTLVSFTGNRLKLPFSSLFSHWKKDFFPSCLSWLQNPIDPPPSLFRCSYNLCPRTAFIEYTRPGLKEDIVDVVCPFHIPKGVTSHIFTPNDNPRPTIFHSPCPKCGYDQGGVEVLNELPVEMGFQPKNHMWNCPLCGCWWVYVSVSLQDMVSNKFGNGLDKFYFPGYNIQKVETSQDPYRNVIHYQAILRPKKLNQISGHKMTIFDHLKLD